MVMRSLLCRVSLAGLVCGSLGLIALAGQSAAPAPPQTPTGPFMRGKLLHGQGLLEGLAQADFSLIERSADKLHLLSLESTWQVFQTADYVTLSEQFRRSTTRLTEAAQAGNLEGATLAYFQMTLECIDCHRHVREHRKK